MKTCRGTAAAQLERFRVRVPACPAPGTLMVNKRVNGWVSVRAEAGFFCCFFFSLPLDSRGTDLDFLLFFSFFPSPDCPGKVNATVFIRETNFTPSYPAGAPPPPPPPVRHVGCSKAAALAFTEGPPPRRTSQNLGIKASGGEVDEIK